MASVGQNVTVTTSPTLVFEFIDGFTYKGLTSPASNIFVASTPNDPVPIMVVLPASGTIYFGGAGVTSSSTGIGAALTSSQVPSIIYNCIGGDSLYAIVASSTAVLQLLTFRQ